ncbi:MAG TPA: hypothetical protein VMV75_12115, partial [Sulfuricella sp.]|nr:hypothetical protein [Sulfuricella sp.]
RIQAHQYQAPTLIGCIFLKNKAPNSSEAAPALPKRGAHSTEFHKNCNNSFAPLQQNYNKTKTGCGGRI